MTTLFIAAAYKAQNQPPSSFDRIIYVGRYPEGDEEVFVVDEYRDGLMLLAGSILTRMSLPPGPPLEPNHSDRYTDFFVGGKIHLRPDNSVEAISPDYHRLDEFLPDDSGEE